MSLDDYTQLFADAGKQYGIDPGLLRAVATVESKGNPKAESVAGAQGVMQLMPAIQKAYGVTDPFNPEQSIPAGARLIAENMHRYGDTHKALMAYNAGLDQTKWNKGYADKVMANYTTDDPDEKLLLDRIKQGPDQSADPDEQLLLDRIQGKTVSPSATPPAQSASTNPDDWIADTAKSIASAPFKAIGAIPQIPAMAGNAVANAMGYTYGKLAGATPEQQQRLNRLNPYFTGNTPFDALLQADNAMRGDAAPANPLTGEVLHDPQTMPGRIASTAIQAGIAGPAVGADTLPSAFSGAAAQLGQEAAPGNPLIPLVAGAVAPNVPRIAAGAARALPFADLEGKTNNRLAAIAGQGNTNLDMTEYVPGSQPTLGTASGNPGLATAERALRRDNPNAFEPILSANNAARSDFVQDLTGTPQSLDTLRNMRDQAALPIKAAAFANAKPVDISPVVSKIDKILASPSGQRDAVVNHLTAIRDKLVNPATEFQLSDPAQLYGVRQDITDRLSPLAARDQSNARLASKELNSVKNDLDSIIQKGAPGYKNYLDTYSKLSRPVDEQEYLQSLNLTDAKGNVTLSKVDNALKNITKAQSLSGVNEAKSIHPVTINKLTALRDDLRREANIDLGKNRGSSTTQELKGAAKGSMKDAAFAALSLAELPANKLTAGAIAGGRGLYRLQQNAIQRRMVNQFTDPASAASAFRPTPNANALNWYINSLIGPSMVSGQ